MISLNEMRKALDLKMEEETAKQEEARRLLDRLGTLYPDLLSTNGSAPTKHPTKVVPAFSRQPQSRRSGVKKAVVEANEKGLLPSIFDFYDASTVLGTNFTPHSVRNALTTLAAQGLLVRKGRANVGGVSVQTYSFASRAKEH